jgi:hypothetical protein
VDSRRIGLGDEFERENLETERRARKFVKKRKILNVEAADGEVARNDDASDDRRGKGESNKIGLVWDVLKDMVDDFDGLALEGGHDDGAKARCGI